MKMKHLLTLGQRKIKVKPEKDRKIKGFFFNQFYLR